MLKMVYDSFKKKFKSQKEEVLYLLQCNSGVSSMEFAMEYGILRYGAAIFQLRKEGFNIQMEERYVCKNGRQQRQTTYKLMTRKASKSAPVVNTNHSKIRFDERFKPNGLKMEDIIKDVKQGCKYIARSHQGGDRFYVKGELGKYIIAKKGKEIVVITMMTYKK